jgi:hypothetical protein
MALPRLNESSQYELVIPSSEQTVKYRPFLVKEQKTLLIAYESQDQRQIISAILTCISNCVENSVDITKLTTFDADYIFTKIRSKSVGEKVKVGAKCEQCKNENNVEINLDDIKLEGDIKPSIVKITEDINLKMKYPNYYEFMQNDNIMNKDITSEAVFEMLSTCIESVMTEEENIVLKDEPREEIERFIESLTTSQFTQVREYVDRIPKIILDFDFTCESCQHNNNHRLEGLQDFFS